MNFSLLFVVSFFFAFNFLRNVPIRPSAEREREEDTSCAMSNENRRNYTAVVDVFDCLAYGGNWRKRQERSSADKSSARRPGLEGKNGKQFNKAYLFFEERKAMCWETLCSPYGLLSFRKHLIIIIMMVIAQYKKERYRLVEVEYKYAHKGETTTNCRE